MGTLWLYLLDQVKNSTLTLYLMKGLLLPKTRPRFLSHQLIISHPLARFHLVDVSSFYYCSPNILFFFPMKSFGQRPLVSVQRSCDLFWPKARKILATAAINIMNFLYFTTRMLPKRKIKQNYGGLLLFADSLSRQL